MATFDRDQNAWYDEMGLRTEAPAQAAGPDPRRSMYEGQAQIEARTPELAYIPEVLAEVVRIGKEHGMPPDTAIQQFTQNHDQGRWANNPQGLVNNVMQTQFGGDEAYKLSMGMPTDRGQLLSEQARLATMQQAQQSHSPGIFEEGGAFNNEAFSAFSALSGLGNLAQAGTLGSAAQAYMTANGAGNTLPGMAGLYDAGGLTAADAGNFVVATPSVDGLASIADIGPAGPNFDFNAVGNSPVSNFQLAGDIPGAGGTGLTGDGTIAAGFDPLTVGETVTPFPSTMSTAELDALVNGTGAGAAELGGGLKLNPLTTPANGLDVTAPTGTGIKATAGAADALTGGLTNALVGTAGAAGLAGLAGGPSATDGGLAGTIFWVPPDTTKLPGITPTITLPTNLANDPTNTGFDWAGKLGGLDWTKILGGALPGLLGAYGADKMADAYKTQSDKYLALGEPYRTRANTALTPGFNGDIPGLTPGLAYAGRAAAQAASATYGNPAGSTNAMAHIQDQLYSKNYAPAYQNYVTNNLTGGGLAALQQSGVGAADKAITQQGNVFNAIGAGMGNIFNPQPTMQDLFKQMFGGKT